MSSETVRILARLHKTPCGGEGYYLRGWLPDGREVQVFSNQHKRRREDPDFLLVEVVEIEGEDAVKSVESKNTR